MGAPLGLCTSLIMLLTGVVSYLGFRSAAIEEKYIFEPRSILAGKQYYRLLTPAFLHAGWQHLLMNLITLYLFGTTVELFLGKVHFLLIYFGAILGGSLLSLYVHRHHEYQAYGASGGVCGILFAHILMLPGSGIYVFPLPFSIPAWLYAIIFLLASFYGMRTGKGNVGHDAHLGGAIVGLLITAGLHPSMVQANLKLFLLILSLATLLLVYLRLNPLFLPATSFLSLNPFSSSKRQRSSLPRYKQEQLQVDAILDKVSQSGIDSLTEGERSLLKAVSQKYQRQADSKKPESELVI